MRTQHRYLLAVVVLMAVGATSTPAGAATGARFDLGFGVEYSSGDYGESSDTDILFVPLSIKYSRAAWSAKAAFSYLSLKGPGSVTGDGVVVTPGEDSRRTESGLGDTWLSLTYALDPAAGSSNFFDLTGKIKLPTADADRGLGTGETDLAIQVDVMRAMNRLTPFATLGYKLMGDPEGIDYEDVMYASVGADWRADEIYNFGLIYDFRQAATRTGEDISEFSAYANRRIDASWSTNVYGVFGTSDGSPAYAIGLQMRYRIR